VGGKRIVIRALATPTVALLAAVAAGCGGDEEAAPPPGAEPGEGEPRELSYELVIGDIVSLTGAENVFGPSFEAAANLAKEELDRAIEAAGIDVTIRLDHADDETTPQGAIAAARRLVAGGASCIAGPLTSGSTLAVAESVTVPEGVPNVAVAASSIQISEIDDDGLVFRLFPSDALQGPALAEVIAADIGAESTLSLAARNDAFGEGFMNVFQPAWEDLGGTALGPVLYDPEAPSLDSEAQRAVQGDPDAFVVLDFPASYAKMGASLLRTGRFTGEQLYVAGGQPARIPDEVPFESMDGAVGTRPGVPQTEAFESFIQLYEGTGGLPRIESFAQNNFDAVILCALASLHAGSNDPRAIADSLRAVSGPPGNKYTWLELDQAIADLAAGMDVDYEGISGSIEFDERGDPQSAIYDIYKYVDGDQTTVGQYDTTTGELRIDSPEIAGFGG
jgi:ABC-type branched-subunit amino acid transport system substrate-binding protein